MKFQQSTVVILSIAIILIAGATWYYSRPAANDSFAQCLTDKGATFYGAFWCPHCQKQKALFGKSMSKVHYVECSTPDGKPTQACKDAKIEGYPTWEFSDKTRKSGEMSLKDLSEKTGCPLP